MQSYFEEYESLQDPDFLHFVDQHLPLGFCKSLPDNLNLVLRHSVLQRSLVGEGAHRHLSSSIRFSLNLESTSELPPHECDVILIERLPSGVYADPFELQHLLQHGGIVLSYFQIENKELLIFCYPLILFVVVLSN